MKNYWGNGVEMQFHPFLIFVLGDEGSASGYDRFTPVTI
jgi:hypothetical protein